MRGSTIASVPVLVVLTLGVLPRPAGAFEVEVLRGSTVTVVQGTPGGQITEVTHREDPTPPPPPVPEAAPAPEPGPTVVVNVVDVGGYGDVPYLGVGFPVFVDRGFRHHGFFPKGPGHHRGHTRPGGPSQGGWISPPMPIGPSWGWSGR